MQKSRITVTVDPELVAIAQQDVAEGLARSLSAWVESAMREKAKAEDLTALLAEIRAEIGPPSKEDIEWANDVLGLSSSTAEP